ncbi:MAG: site-2 protease family protein [Candidatus Nomurabacteria bacterium]|jgi:Zn-dependent protease|nr:site-2 protease family protein [Candidatus Nomurabacteria bacterium]
MSILIALVVIIISMTLHELAHGYVAYWLGDDTAKAQGRLSLNPIKHLDPVLSLALPLMMAVAGGPIFGGAKPVPLNLTRIKWGDIGVACVAIAGPLTNLLLAYMLFLVAYYSDVAVGSILGTALIMGVQINLGFFVFNMIPIPPLDGSRILYALAPDFIKRFMDQVERYGFVIVLVLVIFCGALLSTYMVGAITFFIDIFSRLVL